MAVVVKAVLFCIVQCCLSILEYVTKVRWIALRLRVWNKSSLPLPFPLAFTVLPRGLLRPPNPPARSLPPS